MGQSIAELLVALVDISLVPRPERVKDETPRLDPADRALRDHSLQNPRIERWLRRARWGELASQSCWW
jgi:hypothetical protein